MRFQQKNKMEEKTAPQRKVIWLISMDERHKKKVGTMKRALI